MLECRNCRELVRGDLEMIGSRCPRCRMPLYERPKIARRLNPVDSEKSCGVHPEIQAIGTCDRCGAPICLNCRTRWYDQALCLACVERALSLKEPPPANRVAQRRQAMVSFVLSVTGLGLFLLGSLLLIGVHQSRPNPPLSFLSTAMIVLSLLPALFAVGQGAALVRIRVERLRLATSALACAGAQLGILMGFLLLNIWHN
jgi:hypothetical protein